MRLFHPTRRYDQIDWNSFPEVVGEFKKQVYAWYVTPARVLLRRSGHSSFASLSLTCTLIDTLSQFYYGHTRSTKTLFIRYCRRNIPELKKRFAVEIPFKKNEKIAFLRDGAAVLYYGIRCGVMHEAHPALYSAISGTGVILTYHETGLAEFTKNGRHFHPCPAVVFDPGPLLEKVVVILRDYLSSLVDTDPANEALRRRFKVKLADSYGKRV